MKRLISLFSVVVFMVGCCTESLESRVEYHDNFPSRYVSPRNVEVWLPSQYDIYPGKRFPVLYMHDGQNVFNPSTAYGGVAWEADSIAEMLVNSGEIEPFIIVAVWNSPTRFNDYMPQKAVENAPLAVREKLNAMRMNGGDTTLWADNYLRFLTQELKPFVDSTYRTFDDRSNTAICGSSMGGLISMYALSEYPQVFGKAGCVSTHWSVVYDNSEPAISQSVRDYMSEKLPKAGFHKIYFDYGTETLDSLYEPHQRKVDSLILSKGYVQGKDWQTLRFEGAQHNEASWQARFDTILKFLYSK